MFEVDLNVNPFCCRHVLFSSVCLIQTHTANVFRCKDKCTYRCSLALIAHGCCAGEQNHQKDDLSALEKKCAAQPFKERHNLMKKTLWSLKSPSEKYPLDISRFLESLCKLQINIEANFAKRP